MLEILKVSGNVSYLLNWVIVEQAHRQQAVKGHLPATVQAISKFEVPPMTGTSITWARKHCRARTAASPPPLVVTGLPGGGGIRLQRWYADGYDVVR